MADLLAAAIRRGLTRMTRRGLRGVWLAGSLPDRPFVWAANHHGWWDPFLAAAVLDAHGRRPGLLVAQENLDRFGFTRRLGAFSGHQPRHGLDLLRAGRVLVIFPEGRLRPAGPLGDLAAGAAWYARHAPAPLYAVATRTALRGHQAPEAYVHVTEVPASGTTAAVTARLAAQLSQSLRQLDALLGTSDPRRELPGFRPVLTGRRSWDERIEHATRRLAGRRRT